MKRLLPLIFSQPFFAISAELPERVDFNDHVQPILSEYCYHCHGPDSSTREPKKAPLRFDREEFAFELRQNGKPVIVKGDANASELIQRIIDQDDPMPPQDGTSHKPMLTPDKVAILKKWINQGAEYEEHWAFIKPSQPTIPDRKWGHNEIDAFIAKKHQGLGLKANAPASAHRILRRLTFDITGLPPTTDEVREFEILAAQDLTTAVKLTTEKLLQTNAYAEHFGRHWLDAVRYGDTHGIHIDNYRSIWPYRNWVIDAFRENKSFKDFTIEQIAGDLLPDASLDQKIATGYGRCMPTTGEGGAIAEEYNVIYAKDQVETTSAIWLGLTTGCAACHDHKFDPISQADFYALTAYFRNTTMGAMDRNSAEHPPNVFAPLNEDRARWSNIDTDITKANDALTARRKSQEIRSDFNTWAIKNGTTPLSKKVSTAEISIPLLLQGKKITAEIDGVEQTFDIDKKIKPLDAPDFGKVPHLDRAVALGKFGNFSGKDQVTFGGFVRLEGTLNGPLISKMNSRDSYRGWDIWLENNRIGSHIIEKWPKRAAKAMTAEPLSPGRWHHIMITYDGKAPAGENLEIFIDGVSQKLKFTHKASGLDQIETDVPVRLANRDGGTQLSGGKAALHSFKLFRRKLNTDEIKAAMSGDSINAILRTPLAERTEAQNKSLLTHYTKAIDPIFAKLRKQRDQLLAEQNRLRKRGSKTLVMEEKKGPAIAHILGRGEYTIREEKVYANIPELFRNGNEKAEGQNRIDLANWLVSTDNPLTARVTVNRIWYYLLGRGLVETTEDFGIMGARPTHPELLDYLAVEFMASGWDVQHIIKLITASATYQLSDKVESAQREKDPTNLYLGRSSRFRLEAEQLRDHALASSGLLVKKVGGPSVKPYQPEGLWEAVAMNQSNTRFYKQDQGDHLYRRSLYTFWKRTAAPASMEILNAPTREFFCVRRDRTNTPLQAFVTLNDVQFLEANRHLSAKAIKSANSFDQRLDFISLALLGRTFKSDEREIIRHSFNRLAKRYKSDPDLAKQLLSNGDSPVDESIAYADHATWMMVTSQVFNLDENLTK